MNAIEAMKYLDTMEDYVEAKTAYAVIRRQSAADPWEVMICKWSHYVDGAKHLAELKQSAPDFEYGMVKIHQEILPT